jgi:hypothetical protein
MKCCEYGPIVKVGKNWRYDSQHNDTQNKGLIGDTQHNGTQHNILCHYVECRCSRCRVLFIIVLNVVMLNVVMLSVVMLSVVAPKFQLLIKLLITFHQNLTIISPNPSNTFPSQKATSLTAAETAFTPVNYERILPMKSAAGVIIGHLRL